VSPGFLVRLMAAALLLAPAAQAADQLPAWAVPVLRLVSATHVEPTTGIVVSSDGLVLVPSDFASPGDEIVVLDGGTDIVRHGRPARIDRRLEYVGLKLLRVDGLRRRPAVFTRDPPADGTPLWLAAFPPAERIAQGAQPLWEERRLVRTPGAGAAALSLNAPLPNVTGALVDSCGYLLGLSIHAGVQDMAPSQATRYRWANEMQDALNSQQVDSRTAACEPETPEPEPEAQTEAAPAQQPEPQAVEHPVEEPQPVPEAELPPAQPAEDEQGLETLEQLPPQEPGSPWRGLWLLAAAVLFATGFAVHYWRRRTMRGDSSGEAQETDEGATWQAPAMTHELVLSGRDAQGREIETACAVSDQAVNCVIGSGDVDLRINEPGVSPAHARIFSTRTGLVVSDLGSGSGTFVDDVPCFDGESLYIDEDSELQLGPVRLQVKLVPGDPVES
jgi:hypothetical protein